MLTTIMETLLQSLLDANASTGKTAELIKFYEAFDSKYGKCAITINKETAIECSIVRYSISLDSLTVTCELKVKSEFISLRKTAIYYNDIKVPLIMVGNKLSTHTALNDRQQLLIEAVFLQLMKNGRNDL